MAVEYNISDRVAGDDLRFAVEVPGVGETQTFVKAWVTIKESKSTQADAQAVASVVIMSGFAYSAAVNGKRTATFSIDIPASQTVLCKANKIYSYDVQVKTSDGFLNTPIFGKITFVEQVTRATS